MLARAVGNMALGRLANPGTALFVCDIQERFRTVITGFPSVIDTSKRMLRAAKVLHMPVVVTEQYPKAFGNTVEELQQHIPEGSPVVTKTKFSMMVPEVADHLTGLGTVKQVLLVGIETHVCVLQTAIDLMESGYEVHIVVDGVSSQRVSDRSVALQRLSQSGALFTTSESAMFQLVGDAKHPDFKAISALVKEERPEPLQSML